MKVKEAKNYDSYKFDSVNINKSPKQIHIRTHDLRFTRTDLCLLSFFSSVRLLCEKLNCRSLEGTLSMKSQNVVSHRLQCLLHRNYFRNATSIFLYFKPQLRRDSLYCNMFDIDMDANCFVQEQVNILCIFLTELPRKCCCFL